MAPLTADTTDERALVAAAQSGDERAFRALVEPYRRTLEVHCDLLRRYVDAWESADMDGLVALLREDAVLSMPPGPSVAGARDIVAFFTDVAGGSARLSATATSANNQPAVLLRERATERFHRLLVLDVEDGRISELHAFRADPFSPER